MNVHSSSSRRRLGKEHANQTWTTFIQNMRPFAALEGLGADWLRLGLGGHVKRAVVLYSCAAGEISRSANMSDCKSVTVLRRVVAKPGRLHCSVYNEGHTLFSKRKPSRTICCVICFCVRINMCFKMILHLHFIAACRCVGQFRKCVCFILCIKLVEAFLTAGVLFVVFLSTTCHIFGRSCLSEASQKPREKVDTIFAFLHHMVVPEKLKLQTACGQ